MVLRATTLQHSLHKFHVALLRFVPLSRPSGWPANPVHTRVHEVAAHVIASSGGLAFAHSGTMTSLVFRMMRDCSLASLATASVRSSRWSRAFTALPSTDAVPEPTAFWETKMYKRFDRMDYNKVRFLTA